MRLRKDDFFYLTNLAAFMHTHTLTHKQIPALFYNCLNIQNESNLLGLIICYYLVILFILLSLFELIKESRKKNYF